MRLNYVENQNGRRVIRFANLFVFLLVAVMTPAITAGLISLVLLRHLRFALSGAAVGFAIFVLALTYSLVMPIDRLPRGA